MPGALGALGLDPSLELLKLASKKKYEEFGEVFCEEYGWAANTTGLGGAEEEEAWVWVRGALKRHPWTQEDVHEALFKLSRKEEEEGLQRWGEEQAKEGIRGVEASMEEYLSYAEEVLGDDFDEEARIKEFFVAVEKALKEEYGSWL